MTSRNYVFDLGFKDMILNERYRILNWTGYNGVSERLGSTFVTSKTMAAPLLLSLYTVKSMVSCTVACLSTETCRCLPTLSVAE
jgi:hypothetical protein